MPKQNSSHPITGTIGDISYYDSKWGPIARKKGGVTGERLASDPCHVRTREAMSEFGAGGKAVKVLRRSLISLIKGTADHRATGRLAKTIMSAVIQDPINGRSLRNITDGNTYLLKGFEFNINCPLNSTLQVKTTTAIDRATGELKWTIVPLVPKQLIKAPKEATHFKIVMAAVEIDFKNDSYISKIIESADMELNDSLTGELEMKAHVTANSIHPLFLVGGIQFVQKIKNGVVYPLNNTGHNALQILEVSKNEFKVL